MTRPNRNIERIKRHRRIRKKVRGTSERPRLCVTKTLRHLYALVVDDTTGRTVAQVSTLDPEIRGQLSGPNVEAAKALGALMAKRALGEGVKAVVFDRCGYPYHGVISAFAQACREGGLEF